MKMMALLLTTLYLLQHFFLYKWRHLLWDWTKDERIGNTKAYKCLLSEIIRTGNRRRVSNRKHCYNGFKNATVPTGPNFNPSSGMVSVESFCQGSKSDTKRVWEWQLFSNKLLGRHDLPGANDATPFPFLMVGEDVSNRKSDRKWIAHKWLSKST